MKRPALCQAFPEEERRRRSKKIVKKKTIEEEDCEKISRWVYWGRMVGVFWLPKQLMYDNLYLANEEFEEFEEFVQT